MVQSKSALYFGLIPYLKKFGIRIYGLPAFPFPNNPQYIPLCLCRYSSGIHRSSRVFSESCPFISADAARQSNACRILLRIIVHRTAPLSFSYTQKRVVQLQTLPLLLLRPKRTLLLQNPFVSLGELAFVCLFLSLFLFCDYTIL